MLASLVYFLLAALNATTNAQSPRCRSLPGDPSYPTTQQFSQFNGSIDGRLITVVPSAQFCKDRQGGCTDAEWRDTVFRSDIPGAMGKVNWEQDYTSNPPSLCFLETAVCGQGDVPLYAVNATQPSHIQAGVLFARAHNLKIVIKASGHDYLGRSTAKDSFLLWTRYMEDITFHDDFVVQGAHKGSAVTVGSGVPMRMLYQAAKAQGKIIVGGSAQNVAPAGGYVQGGGHSVLSPTLGLAIDNTLEFKVVLANGDLVTVNEVSNPDLFWAMRGGGPGSWGVLVSATFRTFPTVNVAVHETFIALNSTAAAAEMAYIHANHIFDLDELHAGQYYLVLPNPPGYVWYQVTYFPNSTIPAANASIAHFMESVTEGGFSIISAKINSSLINDQLSQPTFEDLEGDNTVLGSRLIPEDVYRNNPAAVRDAYRHLLDSGAPSVMGLLVAGGRVSQNANVSAAINPKWRTAKVHSITFSGWTDATPPDVVESIREDFTNNKVPILQALAGGPDSGAYVNEADVREPNFQTTFYGPNYARLSAIKQAYDPDDFFIVGSGVGSERWDEHGLCRI